MFLKVLMVVAAAVAVIAEDKCKCKDEANNKEFWAHLESISKDIDATQDKAGYAVLPAVLSPLVDCDCSEKNRPKRKIMPDVPDKKKKPHHPHHKPKSPSKMTPIRHGDRHCPQNFVRVGIMCIQEDEIE